MAIVAVLGAAFSLREKEPNPCNVRLAVEAVRICVELKAQGHTPILVVQWEVGLAVKHYGQVLTGSSEEFIKNLVTDYHEIGQYDDGRYLGTKELFEEALPFFKKAGATHFVAVANPFLHQPYAYLLARKRFKPLWRRVYGIGFDKQSTQWWCRSWWQLLAYTVWLKFGGAHGHNGRQVKA